VNGLERVLAAVHFRPTDRLPAVPQVFGHTAILADVRLGDYLRDGRLLAECQLAAQRRYGYDAVFTFMDLYVETEALGSTLCHHADAYPDVSIYGLEAGEDPAALKRPDPGADGRMPEVLEAARLLRERVGEQLLVVGGISGPMTLATQLSGFEATLFLAVDRPADFERLLDYTTDVGIDFGVAQIRAGAHLSLVLEPSGSPAVVPADFFRRFLVPRLKRQFTAFREAGAVTTWLDIAGPTASILPYYSEIGAEIANFDYEVSAAEAQRCLPATCLDGNLKSLDFLLASPEQILRDASAVRDAFAHRGGLLLSSGCEIPPLSRPENVDALIAACAR
jgi:uroporphyrinogen decarboxylase